MAALAVPEGEAETAAARRSRSAARLLGEPMLDFACPVCASPLRVPQSQREAAGTCPVCASGVTAPRVGSGGRAMPYRDWLRLQEIDLGGPPSRTRTVPARPAPAPPRRFRHRWTALAAAVASGTALVSWLALPQPSTAGPASAPPRAASGAPEAPPAPAPDFPAPIAAAPIAAAPAPAALASAAVEPPLAAVLRLEDPAAATAVVVRAARTRSFGRSAPAEDVFLCLKITEETDPSVAARAYVPAATALAAAAEALLPWGREGVVSVRLRWQPPLPSDALTGHWQVEALAPAPLPPGTLTSVR